MDRDYPADPYAPPGSDLDAGQAAGAQGAELAGRATRLGAVVLDLLLISIPLLPLMGVAAYVGYHAQALAEALARAGQRGPGLLPRGEEALLVEMAPAVTLGLLFFLAIVIYQWVLISRTGQSLGKKWTGIRIERLDGFAISFATGVLLRNWVPKLIGGVPTLGAVFQIVDCLFIFRDDRRCIHDHMAGTRVVRQQR
jgi:uncharacterized RDD family membrane protein YckC